MNAPGYRSARRHPLPAPNEVRPSAMDCGYIFQIWLLDITLGVASVRRRRSEGSGYTLQEVVWDNEG